VRLQSTAGCVRLQDDEIVIVQVGRDGPHEIARWEPTLPGAAAQQSATSDHRPQGPLHRTPPARTPHEPIAVAHVTTSGTRMELRFGFGRVSLVPSEGRPSPNTSQTRLTSSQATYGSYVVDCVRRVAAVGVGSMISRWVCMSWPPGQKASEATPPGKTTCARRLGISDTRPIGTRRAGLLKILLRNAHNS
jgi:hypothetical protein